MKKLLVVLSFGCLTVISCGGGNNKGENDKKENTEEAVATAEDTEKKDPDYEKGLELVAKSDCFTCHKVNEQLTGPAYQAVADRYQKTDATIDSLATKVIKGGAGNWGQVPMTPHPQLSQEDARTMVKYVLSLKKS